MVESFAMRSRSTACTAAGRFPVFLVHDTTLMHLYLMFKRLSPRSMMVESFISSQKYSVHRALRQRFRRYLVSASDYHSLALHLLRQLLREEQRSAQVR